MSGKNGIESQAGENAGLALCCRLPICGAVANSFCVFIAIDSPAITGRTSFVG
ncbi:hypothetical protein [Saccharothrix deserti]|uniref:hypothetical protein n=1 Tax=Saccharothrix deserti TaxID=2593674 RepID=UPI001390EA3C|nr:hypothetical protein [Saccharothrix deserti]